MTRSVVGVFVGGRGERLGGVDKGLLRVPDGSTTLIERARDVIRAALPSSDLVLVGSSGAYAHLGLVALAERATPTTCSR